MDGGWRQPRVEEATDRDDARILPDVGGEGGGGLGIRR